MNTDYNPEYIDREEQELMEDLESIDETQIPIPTGARQRELKQSARQELQKRQTKMNIRIDEKELERIKAQASKEGLKYQTLVKSVLHKYVTGQLVDRDSKNSQQDSQ